LQSLKSQLQPHFLFNTLHSISALMLTDVAAADRMMCRLSDLLRLSLETADTQITTLKRELEFVNCYLEIEKVRFEERLKVNYVIAPETLDAELPYLLLQPLVDNAVKHGIAKAPNGGEISIISRCVENKLQIEIKNSEVATHPFHTTTTRGVGLRVTKERLASLYGEDQTFELENSPEGYTTARVEIPLKMQASEFEKNKKEEEEEILLS
jgi:LytS/YehU family sensor histidine kinase